MRRPGPIEYEIYMIGVEDALCVGCGKCVDICPTDVFRMITRPEGTPRPEPVPGRPPADRLALVERSENCLYCQGCVGVCPGAAITITEI